MKIDSGNSVLGVFVKNLIPGTYKTRLAAATGNEEVREIYLTLLKHTERVVSDFPGDVWVYYNQSLSETGLFKRYRGRLQKGNDLGEKMHRAFIEMLEEHQKAIIIGSDCPVIESHHLSRAIDLLSEKDAVLGPSEDGGYYLIGLKNPVPSLFQGINWSTDSVVEETIDMINAQGLSYGLLDQLFDVDRYEDWMRYQNMIRRKG